MDPFEMQRLFGGLCLTAVALACQPLHAQERLAPVEVNSSAPRVDVQRSCPGYGEALKDSLARYMPYVDSPAELRVTFELRDGQVAAVRTAGGAPYEYRRSLRRAMHNVSCVSDNLPNQQYTFRVVFKPRQDGADDQHLAVIDGQTLAQKD